MTGGKVANDDDHYISRILTKPWEDVTRHLHYFDFGDGKIKVTPSKSLFVAQGLWSREIERFFGRAFEAQLDGLRTIGRREGGVVNLPWKKFKALAFLFISHVARLAEVHSDTSAVAELEALLTRYEDHLVHAWTQKWDICSMEVQGPLCFPESVGFAVPVLDKAGHLALGHAIPIDVNEVILHLPKGTDPEFLCEQAKTQAFVSLSAGAGRVASRVLIHPRLRDSMTDAELAHAITSNRRTNEELVAAIAMYADFLREYGISPKR